MRARRRSGFRFAVVLACHATACAPAAWVPPPPAAPPPFRISSLGDSGDPAWRASVQLLLDGLDSDAQGSRSAARNQYEYALRVDPGNPYVYLVLARHFAEGTEPARAAPYLDKFDALVATRSLPLGAEAHRAGLRGALARAAGDAATAERLLAKARSLAPVAWSDGHLSARELR